MLDAATPADNDAAAGERQRPGSGGSVGSNASSSSHPPQEEAVGAPDGKDVMELEVSDDQFEQLKAMGAIVQEESDDATELAPQVPAGEAGVMTEEYEVSEEQFEQLLAAGAMVDDDFVDAGAAP